MHALHEDRMGKTGWASTRDQNRSSTTRIAPSPEEQQVSCEAQHIQKELIQLKGTVRKGADRKMSASRRVSTSCTPLSDGGVAAAASARRASWIGLTRQLSEANLDQVGQPRVLTRLSAGDPAARHGSTVMVERTGSVKIAAGEVSSGALGCGSDPTQCTSSAGACCWPWESTCLPSRSC